MIKVVFAGTPDFSKVILEHLLSHGVNIQACLTQPDRRKGRGQEVAPTPVKTLALQHDIPCFTPKSLKNSEIITTLAELAPDVIIVVAYGLIIPKPILSLPKFGCINIHASILPRWRGAAPIQHAILHGDQESGITIMQMDPGLDTGDIIAMHPCAINKNETSASLYDKLSDTGKHAIMEFINNINNIDAKNNTNTGTDNNGYIIPSRKQDNTQATYAHKITKQQANVDWQQPAINIERAIRAYQPWPVAFTYYNGKNIRIWQAEIIDNLNNIGIVDTVGIVDSTSDAFKSLPPGSIYKINNDSIEVVTGDKLLKLIKIQLPGKKALLVKDILHARQGFFHENTKFTHE